MSKKPFIFSMYPNFCLNIRQNLKNLLQLKTICYNKEQVNNRRKSKTTIAPCITNRALQESIKLYICYLTSVCLWKLSLINIQMGAEAPLLSSRLDWTQSNVNHWNPWKRKREGIENCNIVWISKQIGQYWWWNPKCGDSCWTNFKIWAAYEDLGNYT